MSHQTTTVRGRGSAHLFSLQLWYASRCVGEREQALVPSATRLGTVQGRAWVSTRSVWCGRIEFDLAFPLVRDRSRDYAHVAWMGIRYCTWIVYLVETAVTYKGTDKSRGVVFLPYRRGIRELLHPELFRRHGNDDCR